MPPGDTLLCVGRLFVVTVVVVGVAFYWHLVGGGQRYCSTSSDAQGRPHSRELPAQEVNSTQAEKPGLDLFDSKMTAEIVQCVYLFYMFKVIHLHVSKFKKYEKVYTVKTLQPHPIHSLPFPTLQHLQLLQVSPALLQYTQEHTMHSLPNFQF